MGVFSRFFGRKEQGSTDGVASEDLTVPSEEATVEATGAEAPAATAAEIPQQKSAEASLDNEAGEGART
ncbi:hypothetical protein ABT144_07055 [Streptomyces sp. NPDC002039]|uniref:hypothetical protein n=1 Tax=unclassified Streptomyces TaxID=2593676 RepID=UPI003320B1C4